MGKVYNLLLHQYRLYIFRVNIDNMEVMERHCLIHHIIIFNVYSVGIMLPLINDFSDLMSDNMKADNLYGFNQNFFWFLNL